MILTYSADNMKAVILAGGWGMRLREQTVTKPKPMVEIGHKPILWHIMKIYSYYGINDFVICLGYKGHIIKDYFANYSMYESVVTFDMSDSSMDVHRNTSEPWRVTLVDTGLYTKTAGRLRKIRNYVDDSDFCMTYGDGVGDIDIGNVIAFHKSHGKSATVTAVRPPARFGALLIENGEVINFHEKPINDGGWINGGFFVLKPEVLDLDITDDMPWEDYPMKHLTKSNQLMAYQHDGFWQPMDTLRDMEYLEELWQSGEAPWKLWK